MSRSSDISVIETNVAAAAAGTVNTFHVIPDTYTAGNGSARAFVVTDFFWKYDTTEANADNTFDYDVTYGAVGTGTDILTEPTNPIGLLDTGAPATAFVNRGGTGAAGAAADAAAAITAVRVPVGNVIRVQIVRAGTGTVPAMTLGLVGYWV
jgi:hypothetical protein